MDWNCIGCLYEREKGVHFPFFRRDGVDEEVGSAHFHEKTTF